MWASEGNAKATERYHHERIRKMHVDRKVPERGSCEHPDIEGDLLSGISLDFKRLRDESKQEPWNPLSLYEGETPPITGRDSFHKISDENRQGHSNYYSTTADSNKCFADSRKAESEISGSTTGSPVRSSFPLRQASFSTRTPTTSALPPNGALVQSAGSIKQASQPQFPLGVSMSERTQKFSTKEEQEDEKLVQGVRGCGLSLESDVRVSFLT